MEPRYDQGQSPQEDPTPGSSGPPTHLVDPATILTEKQILSESWNLTRLYSALPEEGVRALQWAARRRLIRNSGHHDDGDSCQDKRFTLRQHYGRTFLRWYCYKCRKGKSCRKGTPLQGKLSIRQWAMILYCWCKKFNVQQTVEEVGLGKSTTLCFFRDFREVCLRYNEKNPIHLGGRLDPEEGLPVVVEVDRKRLGKARTKDKVKKAAMSKRGWIICGVERKSGLAFLASVKDCTPAAVKRVFTKHILPGSRIITEGEWAKQLGVEKWGYAHGTFKSKGRGGGFVDTEDRNLNTNAVKRYWGLVKRGVVRQQKQNLESWMQQLMFRKRAQVRGHGCFQAMLLAMQEVYRSDVWEASAPEANDDRSFTPVYAWPEYRDPKVKQVSSRQTQTGAGEEFHRPSPPSFPSPSPEEPRGAEDQLMRGTVIPNLPFAPKSRERKVIRVPEVLSTSARSLSGRSVIGPPTLRFAGLQSHQAVRAKIKVVVVPNPPRGIAWRDCEGGGAPKRHRSDSGSSSLGGSLNEEDFTKTESDIKMEEVKQEIIPVDRRP